MWWLGSGRVMSCGSGGDDGRNGSGDSGDGHGGDGDGVAIV